MVKYATSTWWFLLCTIQKHIFLSTLFFLQFVHMELVLLLGRLYANNSEHFPCRAYYQAWRDLTIERGKGEELEEIGACQMLMVAISKKLGNKSSFLQSISLQDLANSGVFEWERSMYSWTSIMILCTNQVHQTLFNFCMFEIIFFKSINSFI